MKDIAINIGLIGIAIIAIPLIVTLTLLGVRFSETVSEGWKTDVKREYQQEERYKELHCQFVTTKDMDPQDYVKICK